MEWNDKVGEIDEKNAHKCKMEREEITLYKVYKEKNIVLKNVVKESKGQFKLKQRKR